MRDWTRDEVRRIGHLVVDLIADHLSSLPDRPVFQPVPAAMARQWIDTPAPESPRTPEEILRLFKDTIEPYPFGNGHPRFWGWVNSPPALMGVFADALAAAMNPSCAGGNHAAIYVERQVIAWFRDLLGFPDESMGYKYPDMYMKYFGPDYQPEPYIVEEYKRARDSKYYETSRLICVNDVYAFDPNAKVNLDQFEDIIGRNFRQPKEGLGWDNSPSAHMWRTISMPDNPL